MHPKLAGLIHLRGKEIWITKGCLLHETNNSLESNNIKICYSFPNEGVPHAALRSATSSLINTILTSGHSASTRRTTSCCAHQRAYQSFAAARMPEPAPRAITTLLGSANHNRDLMSIGVHAPPHLAQAA